MPDQVAPLYLGMQIADAQGVITPEFMRWLEEQRTVTNEPVVFPESSIGMVYVGGGSVSRGSFSTAYGNAGSGVLSMPSSSYSANTTGRVATRYS